MRKILLVLMVVVLQYANASRDFLVDSEWLSDHIDDKNLVVMEVRYYPHRYNTVGHIPGAVQVKRLIDLGDNMGNPIMRFPSKEVFQKTLRGYGVNDNSTLVLYDDASTVLVARLYYLLELYGFNMKHVKILNGGTTDWTSFEEMTKEKPEITKGDVTLKDANHNIFIEWDSVYRDVVSKRDPNIVLLDARIHDMYTGKVSTHSVLEGHIPGAINIVSLNGTDGGVWKSQKELEKMYSNIPKDKTVYLYCDDGFRMSLGYLQLKSLGYKKIKLYNGGWEHWGNQPHLPTVDGEKPYAGGYNL